MNATGNTVLITGGGSGIGRALARRFYELGNSVIVAGRRADALDEVVMGRRGMTSLVLNVEDPAAIVAFAARVTAEHPGLNVLINNAGIMRTEDLTAERDLTDAEATITTNLLGPIRLTNALISHLTGKSDAMIVNTSSGLAFVPLVATPTYSATKAAIHSYTVSLREQLRGKVEVIELIPPAVQTDLTPGQSDKPDYMPLEAFTDEVMALFERQPTPAEICVERVGPLRGAEAEGRFEHMVVALNSN